MVTFIFRPISARLIILTCVVAVKVKRRKILAVIYYNYAATISRRYTDVLIRRVGNAA